jgi:hypothetical protein
MSHSKKFIEENLKSLIKYDNVNDDLIEFFKSILENIHSLRELKKKVTNEYSSTRALYSQQKELYNKEIRLLESKVLDMNRELREFDRVFVELRNNLGRLQITSEESLLQNIQRFDQITQTRVYNCRRQSYIFGIEIYYDYINQYNNKFQLIIDEYSDSKASLSSSIQKFYEDLLQVQTCCDQMFHDEFIVKEQYNVLISKLPTETKIEDVNTLPELKIHDVKQIMPRVYNDADFTDDLAFVQIVQQQTPQQTPRRSPKRSRQSQTMIQCDACSKWRICTKDVAEQYKNDVFICEMNTWNTRYNTCDIPDDNIDYSNQNEVYLSDTSSNNTVNNNTNVSVRESKRRRRHVIDSDDDVE